MKKFAAFVFVNAVIVAIVSWMCWDYVGTANWFVDRIAGDALHIWIANTAESIAHSYHTIIRYAALAMTGAAAIFAGSCLLSRAHR